MATNALQSQDPSTVATWAAPVAPVRSEGQLSDHWRKVLRGPYEKADGNVMVALAAVHGSVAALETAAASAPASILNQTVVARTEEEAPRPRRDTKKSAMPYWACGDNEDQAREKKKKLRLAP